MPLKAAEGVVRIIDKATKPLRSIAEGMKKLKKQVADTNGKFTGFENGINKISKAQNRLNRTQSSIKRNTRDMAGQATGVIAWGLAFKQVLEPAIKFEQSMKDLEAVAFGSASAMTDVTGQMAMLSKQAKRLGATTSFSATQAAEGQIFLAKAGFKTNEIIAAMPGLLSLAAASGTELARSSDILSDLLGAFGTTAKDTGKLVDILASATSSANVDMETLFETLKVAAPIGITAGQSIEGIVAATAILGNVGIKGSMAGTALKNSFVNLASPAAKGSKVLKELGVSATNSNGDMLSLQKIMVNLGKATKDLSQSKRIKAFDAIFGKIAIAGALNLEKAVNSGDFEKMVKNLENSAGVAEKMAKIRLDSTSGSLKILMSSLEGVAIMFGNILTPAIKGTANVLSAMGEPLQKLISDNKGLIEILGGLFGILLTLKIASLAYSATLWLLLPAISGVSFAMSALKVIMIASNAVMAANPIGLIVIAVAALAAGAALLIANWEPVTKFFSDLWVTIKGLAESFSKLSLVSGIMDQVNKTVDFFGGNSSSDNQVKSLSDVGQTEQDLIKSGNTNNQAIINVNIEDGKVKSIDSQGGFKAKANVNTGLQQ